MIVKQRFAVFWTRSHFVVLLLFAFFPAHAFEYLHLFPQPFQLRSTAVEGVDGSFYGVSGGGANGRGAVYRMTTNGNVSILFSFGGTNGEAPVALMRASDGNFYGTTIIGGDVDGGTAFKITPSGELTSLVSFGWYQRPGAGLVEAADGNFYGTTSLGGYGTVFKMTPAGALTTLASFARTNGATPMAPLIQGSDGNFYGTTFEGGSDNMGTVFKMAPNGDLTLLASFQGTNGANPQTRLIEQTNGNFYGIAHDAIFEITPTGLLTVLASVPSVSSLEMGPNHVLYGTSDSGGEFHSGSVFKVTQDGTVTTLFSFSTGETGASPFGLFRGADGSLLGTTASGGSSGSGTLFRMTPAGDFTAVRICVTPDGMNPLAGLLQASDGNFYGTTSLGGDYGNGTIFKMTPEGVLTTLMSFKFNDNLNGLVDKGAELIQGSDGHLYGTSVRSGTNAFGTVFKLSLSGEMTTLFAFNQTNGKYPGSRLLEAADGFFYGTTMHGGGEMEYGTVFKMSPTGDLTTLVRFDLTNGAVPLAGLVQGNNGNFYGTTTFGGEHYGGTVFKMTPQGLLTTLFSFSYTNGVPRAGLIKGIDGCFYGTADSSNRRGTIFKITPEGIHTELAEFIQHGSPNGYQTTLPALLQASDGTIYGCMGYETLFKLNPEGGTTPLIWFNDLGILPQGPLIQGTDGALYGTSACDNSLSGGVIFRVKLPVPRLSWITVSDGNVNLGWESVPGRSYQVQYKNSFDEWRWTTLGAPVTAIGTSTSVSDQNATNDFRIYSIR